MHRWEDLGEQDGARFSVCGDTFMMSIDDMHIRHDGLDRQAEDFGIKVDDVIEITFGNKPVKVKVLSTDAPMGKDVAREMYQVIEE